MSGGGGRQMDHGGSNCSTTYICRFHKWLLSPLSTAGCRVLPASQRVLHTAMVW
jgi:putative component of membrane protein insertase Oxa1/YidC/SpoIIIJ protein YidD